MRKARPRKEGWQQISERIAFLYSGFRNPSLRRTNPANQAVTSGERGGLGNLA